MVVRCSFDSCRNWRADPGRPCDCFADWNTKHTDVKVVGAIQRIDISTNFSAMKINAQGPGMLSGYLDVG